MDAQARGRVQRKNGRKRIGHFMSQTFMRKQLVKCVARQSPVALDFVSLIGPAFASYLSSLFKEEEDAGTEGKALRWAWGAPGQCRPEKTESPEPNVPWPVSNECKAALVGKEVKELGPFS
jgi:hypothetical protein